MHCRCNSSCAQLCNAAPALEIDRKFARQANNVLSQNETHITSWNCHWAFALWITSFDCQYWCAPFNIINSSTCKQYWNYIDRELSRQSMSRFQYSLKLCFSKAFTQGWLDAVCENDSEWKKRLVNCLHFVMAWTPHLSGETRRLSFEVQLACFVIIFLGPRGPLALPLVGLSRPVRPFRVR